MAELDIDRTIVALPFPEAGRTMYQGHLFVNGDPLDETSMRHHPITPMTDSRILRLLIPQTRQPVHEARLPQLAGGAAELERWLDSAGPGITIVDGVTRTDLDILAEATSGWRLVSGGAGLAASFNKLHQDVRSQVRPVPGYRAVLAGSASVETQRQIADARPLLPTRKLDLHALREDFDAEVEALSGWASTLWREDPLRPVLIYSVGEQADIDLSEAPDGTMAAQLTELALGRCAVELTALGMRQLIVAGGETSGSVTNALGIRSFDVGEPLSPGVAWSVTRGGEEMNLLLKSGSLGSIDIFTKAWSALDSSPADSTAV